MFDKNSEEEDCRCYYDRLKHVYGIDYSSVSYNKKEAEKKIKKLLSENFNNKEIYTDLKKLYKNVIKNNCVGKYRIGSEMEGCDPRIQKYSIGEDLITKCIDIEDRNARLKHSIEFLINVKKEEKLAKNLQMAESIGRDILKGERESTDTDNYYFPSSEYRLVKIYEDFPPWSAFKHAYYNHLLAPGRKDFELSPYKIYMRIKSFYDKKKLGYYFKFVHI